VRAVARRRAVGQETASGCQVRADLRLEPAEILWKGGDAKAAMPLVTSAIGLYERKGNVVSAARACSLVE